MQERPAPERVLGIDPGSRVTGWGVVERAGGELRVVAFGTFRLGDGPMPARLVAIHSGIETLLATHSPGAFAIEEAFVGQNVRAAIRLAEARSVGLLAAETAGCPISEVPPTLVKKSVTGHGRASKDVVRSAVMHLLRWEEDAPPPAYDASDALAVALCVLLRSGARASLIPRGVGRNQRRNRRWTAADLARHQASIPHTPPHSSAGEGDYA